MAQQRQQTGMRIFVAALALLLTAPSAAAEPAGPESELTLVFTDRTGGPSARAEVTLTNLDTGENQWTDSTTGTTTMSAEPGRHALFAIVYTGQSEVSLLVWPGLDVTGPATLALDAREAKPVRVRVPHRDAVIARAVLIAMVGYTVDGERRQTPVAISDTDAPTVSSAQIGPGRPDVDLLARVKLNLTAPDIATSPYHYALVFEQDGGMWTGLDRRVRAGELRTVRADYAALAGATGGHTGTSVLGGGYDHTISVPMALPHRRTEYYSEGAEWGSTLCYGETCLSGPPSTRWNYGPFLPSARLIERLDDRIRVIAGIADQSGHCGLAESDIRDGRFTLYRDGVLVGEAPLDRPGFTGLPPETATYRLEFAGAMTSLLPGEFHAAWTFRSAHAPIGEGRLPSLNVRFTPRLDPHNHAPAGRPLDLPIRVDGGPVRDPRVEVSFDGGTTWRNAPVRPTAQGWTTRVTPPAGAADISLRAHATGHDETSVVQTMTRAIPLRPAGG